MAADDIVKVLRVIEMKGPRSWVEGTLKRSWLQPQTEKPVGLTRSGATIRELARVLEVVPPAEEEEPESARITSGPTPINSDGSPCPECGNQFIHGWVAGKPCSLAPAESEPRLHDGTA